MSKSFSANMSKSGSSIVAFLEATVSDDDVPETVFILIPGSFHFQEVEAKSVAPFLGDILRMNFAILDAATGDHKDVMGSLMELSYMNPKKFTSDKPINVMDVLVSESFDFMSMILSEDAAAEKAANEEADDSNDDIDLLSEVD